MVNVRFRKQVGKIVGVNISGHSGYAAVGEDIVCAAVTSAVRLCECTINDIIGADADVFVSSENVEIDIELPKVMPEDMREKCQIVLDGFHLHISALEEEFPKFIKVSEV